MHLHARNEVIGRRIIGGVHFPAKRIGSCRREFPATGFSREDGAVAPAVPERVVSNGTGLA